MRVLQEQQQKGGELYNNLIQKSWTDSNFKADLIKNPVATLASFVGKEVTLPANVQLIVEDQSNPSIVYINIPKRVSLDNFELTDEQLDLVSGGEVAIAALVVGSFLAGVSIGIALAVI